MIKYAIIDPEDLLILRPGAPLEASDFEFLSLCLGLYTAKNEKLPGLMIHAKKFRGWKDLAAFSSHILFVKVHLKQVMRFAMVSDSVVLTDLSRVAAHLIDAEVKHFAFARYDEALEWLEEGAKPASMRGKVA